jgi:hypothetical protein
MKEFIIDLYPKGGAGRSQTRIFASNLAAAFLNARKLYPNCRIGSGKQIN